MAGPTEKEVRSGVERGVSGVERGVSGVERGESGVVRGESGVGGESGARVVQGGAEMA